MRGQCRSTTTMALGDYHVQNLCRQVLQPLCVLLVLVSLLRYWLGKMSRDYKRQIQKAYDAASLKHRERLLIRGLQRQAVTVQRPLRILELGVRTGVNFRFYPNGCDLVCLTPSAECVEPIEDTLIQDYPNIRLVHCTHGGGELLAGIGTSYCDAVVCTLSLKEEANPDRTIREIYRILRPNGCCYFIEQTVASSSSRERLRDLLLRPVCFMLGIRQGPVHSDVLASLRSAPFREIRARTRYVGKKGDHWRAVLLVPHWNRWLLVGAAIK